MTIGLDNGFIAVYRPDGSLYTIFDGSDNLGIIYNDIEEKNGPNGGGTINGLGYVPNIIEVSAQEAGIWTVVFDYPQHSTAQFDNILNSASWTRATNQPRNQIRRAAHRENFPQSLSPEQPQWLSLDLGCAACRAQ